MDDRGVIFRNAASTQLFAGLLDSRIPSIYRHRDVAYPRIGEIMLPNMVYPLDSQFCF